MASQRFTRYTCDACGKSEDVTTDAQPGGWSTVAFVYGVVDASYDHQALRRFQICGLCRIDHFSGSSVIRDLSQYRREDEVAS